MYGIVNQAIQGLITENFGKEKWEEVKKVGHVTQDVFLSNESYEDDITYDLVGAASEVLKIPASDVLFAFGEYWVLNTGHKKYGDLMKSGGANFYDFVKNLPNFHGRIMLIYPKLSPPEFKVEEINEKELVLHYFSSRQGLTDFVRGLVNGLGKLFDTQIEITLTDSSHHEVWHDVFHVKIV